ncbi:MAG: LPS export ABC transporter permease LptG [Bdellovibrionaceae bacterium]|nr:LPS export ABC transporter permease LptG [Bdellovibrio sp.]
MISRIDKYLLGLFWVSFAAGLLIFLSLFVATDAMTSFVRYKDVAASVFFRYYIFYTPEILYKMLPIACVVGTVMTISSLNKGSELVALFASGLSLFRISRSLFVSILFLCAFSYILSDQLLPIFSKQKNFIYYNEIEKTPSKFQTIKTNRIWYRSKNSIFNIKTLNAEGNRAQGLTLYFFNDAWELIQMLTADSVTMNGSQWALRNGTVTVFSKDSSFPLNDKFFEKTIVMSEEAQDLRSTGQTSDLLTQSELSRFISKNKDAGLDTIKYEVDFHSKFSFALAGLVMSLLALPFCVGHSRGGGMMKNIGICLGLVLVYWIFYSSAQTLGQHNQLAPLLAAWLPNVVMTALGTVLLLRAKR